MKWGNTGKLLTANQMVRFRRRVLPSAVSFIRPESPSYVRAELLEGAASFKSVQALRDPV